MKIKTTKKNVAKIVVLTLVFVMIAGTLSACNLENRASAMLKSYMNQISELMLSGDALSINILLSNPAALGLENENGSLPVPTIDKARYKEGTLSMRTIVSALTAIKDKHLSAVERREKEVIINYFSEATRKADFFYFQSGYLGKSDGINATLPIYLDRYGFYDKHDIANFLNLMNETATVFPTYIQFEKICQDAGFGRADFVYEGIAEQCTNFAGSDNSKDATHYLIADFIIKIDACSFLTEAEKAEYKEAQRASLLQNVLPAYRQLNQDILNFVGNPKNNNQGMSHFQNGQNFYRIEFASASSSSDTLETAVSKIAAAHDKLSLERSVLVQSLTDSGVDVSAELEKLEDNADMSISTLKKHYLALKTAISADFPLLPSTIPDANFRAVNTSLANNYAPASYFKSAIDSASAPEYIYINEGATGGYLGFDIIAHEGMPGHQLQHAYFKTSGAHMLRSLLSYIGYSEGWATYAENYSSKYFVGTKEEKQLYQIYQLSNQISSYEQSLFDIFVNYNGFSKIQLRDLILSLYNGKDEAALIDYSDRIFNHVVANPTNSISYNYGNIKLLELKNSFKGTDLQFHTAVLGAGAMPFELLQKYI